MEKDAQQLANRIALLKQEEAKTRKKIEETKKKSKEIMQKKQKLEDRQSKVAQGARSRKRLRRTENSKSWRPTSGRCWS